MSLLVERLWEVRVGAVDVTNLDIEFTITKGLKKEPNECELRVYNLTSETAAQIRTDGSEEAQIQVSAGYKSTGTELLFVGSGKRIRLTKEGPDLVLVANIKDGGRKYRTSRFNANFPPGTRISTVLEQIATALGVGFGNLRDFSGQALNNGSDIFQDGYAFEGPAHKALTGILRGQNLRWSIQNGSLQILRAGRPLNQAEAVNLKADSGLVGSPQADEKGQVTATALLIPGLSPGRVIRLESRTLSGNYKIDSVQYVGNTRGLEWYANLDLRPY